MECPMKDRRNTNLLLDYCAERLAGEAASDLARHIASCPACDEWVRRQNQLWEALDVFEGEPVSPDFDRKLFDRIAEEDRRKRWWSIFRPGRPAFGRPVGAALSLALASLLVLAAILIERPRPAAAPAPGAAKVEAIDADRIEKALDDVDMLRELSVAGTSDARSL
jgi:anti-sigma factor RsiW